MGPIQIREASVEGTGDSGCRRPLGYRTLGGPQCEDGTTWKRGGSGAGSAPPGLSGSVMNGMGAVRLCLWLAPMRNTDACSAVGKLV